MINQREGPSQERELLVIIVASWGTLKRIVRTLRKKRKRKMNKKKTRKPLQLLLVVMLLSFHLMKRHVLVSQVMPIG